MLQNNEIKMNPKKISRLISWGKGHILGTGVIAKLQPTIFATMIFNIIYGVAYLIISSVKLSLFMGMTGAYSLIFGITKGYSLKRLKTAQNPGDKKDIEKIENVCGKNIAVCAAAMSFIHLSFAIVSTFFFEENPANYTALLIYFIAGSAFVKIALALINSVRTRKNHSKIIHLLKLTDVANSLISLGLTQRAILYFTGHEYAKLISGIGGMVFSLAALTICTVMLLRQLKEKGYNLRAIFKKK